MAAVDAAVVLFATALLTAVVGSVVAVTAYRGYRRNDSEPMLYLAVGIACITVGPFLVTYGVAPVAALSDAAALLGVLFATIAGLLAILYSLEGT
ncbi:DUF7521 family protein [Natronomonas marina]|jgi:hypothetical protein|uniref:DUF7521 family protein n=1 Tax=Natronomonas marina TaxID=2961939 RepID=UPI0020C9EBF1|nr:hypothetical protein [Natronomonas marina]